MLSIYKGLAETLPRPKVGQKRGSFRQKYPSFLVKKD